MAGTTAAAMYVEGKTGIMNDIRAIRGMKRGQKIWEEAGIYTFLLDCTCLIVCSEDKEN